MVKIIKSRLKDTFTVGKVVFPFIFIFCLVNWRPSRQRLTENNNNNYYFVVFVAYLLIDKEDLKC